MTDLKSLSVEELFEQVKQVLSPTFRYVRNQKTQDFPYEAELKVVVDELVRRGVYPEKGQIGTPAVKMVIFYGWDWHTYRPPLKCRHCGEDLRNHKYGPPFKRELAILNTVDCDFIDHYECPKCRGIL